MNPAAISGQDIILWFAGLGTVVSVITAMWTIFSGPSRKNTTKITEVEVILGKHEIEIQRLRDKVEGLPNAQMMHRLELSMTRMEGHIDRLDERLKPVAAIAERMQDLLIEQGHK